MQALEEIVGRLESELPGTFLAKVEDCGAVDRVCPGDREVAWLKVKGQVVPDMVWLNSVDKVGQLVWHFAVALWDGHYDSAMKQTYRNHSSRTCDIDVFCGSTRPNLATRYAM